MRPCSGWLAATGMRLGEALGLDRADADLDGGVLTIRDGKFGRSRLVPLHPTVTSALASYAARRDRLCPSPAATRFFVSTAGTRAAHQRRGQRLRPAHHRLGPAHPGPPSPGS